jgi:hypothetical protein
MATTTPNYGWPVPTSTDYVKDGATAIEALGDAIDATVFGLGSAGLTLVTTSTFTTQSSVSINNCFSTTYESYLIVSSLKSSSLLDINLRLRVSATDSTTGYYGRELQNLGGTVYTKTNASEGYFAICGTNAYLITTPIINPFNAIPTSWSSYAIGGSGGGAPYVVQSGNSHDVNTSYTGFTILPTSGTISGTVRVYGYKKS